MLRKKRPVVKVGVFSDPYGTITCGTVEEEFDRTVKYITETMPEAKVSAYLEMSFYPETVKPGTNLIMFDYGGMSLGNSLAEDNSSRLVRYAIDNPGVLCIVNSSYTWHCTVKWIAEEIGPDLPANLMVMEYNDEMESLIRKWCLGASGN